MATPSVANSVRAIGGGALCSPVVWRTNHGRPVAKSDIPRSVTEVGARSVIPLLLALVATTAPAADYPPPREADYTIRDFKFTDGETLPELRVHYRTLGATQKDAQGKTLNA